MSAWGGGMPGGGQGFGNHMMNPGTGPKLNQSDFGAPSELGTQAGPAQPGPAAPPPPPQGGYAPFGGGGAQYNGPGQASTFQPPPMPQNEMMGQVNTAAAGVGGSTGGGGGVQSQPFGGGAQMPVRPTGPFGPTMQRPMGDAGGMGQRPAPQSMARPMMGQPGQYPQQQRQMGPPPSSILARMRGQSPSTGGPPPNGMSPREAMNPQMQAQQQAGQMAMQQRGGAPLPSFTGGSSPEAPPPGAGMAGGSQQQPGAGMARGAGISGPAQTDWTDPKYAAHFPGQ